MCKIEGLKTFDSIDCFQKLMNIKTSEKCSMLDYDLAQDRNYIRVQRSEQHDKFDSKNHDQVLATHHKEIIKIMK